MKLSSVNVKGCIRGVYNSQYKTEQQKDISPDVTGRDLFNLQLNSTPFRRNNWLVKIILFLIYELNKQAEAEQTKNVLGCS